MAHFYGNAVGYATQDPSGSVRLNMYRGQTYNYDRINGNSPSARTLPRTMSEGSDASLLALIHAVETPGSGGGASSCYVLGGLGFEVLTAVYGQDRIVAFMTLFNESRDWRTNFNAAFGLGVEEFYSKLLPYLRYWGTRML
jgi:hypothetical protein